MPDFMQVRLLTRTGPAIFSAAFTSMPVLTPIRITCAMSRKDWTHS